MLISVIIPCFNEQEVVQTCYRRISEVLINNNNTDFELIFIDDGSKDSTYNILEKIALSDSKVKIINFSRNFGHQTAVTAGLNHCKGDIAIIIDADLQDPPEVIPQMIQVFEEKKCNVVYGVRKNRKGESLFKKGTAKYFYRFLNRMSEIAIPNDTGDFRLIDRKIIDSFNNLKERNKYIRGLISWMGFKQEALYYDREARFAGETKYPFRKMMRFAAIALFYFSKKPLKIATGLGVITILLGLIFAIWIILNKMFNPDFLISGWTSLSLLIIFFGGVQLITIGVLGQYIGSLFDEIKNRPEYIIQNKINL